MAFPVAGVHEHCRAGIGLGIEENTGSRSGISAGMANITVGPDGTEYAVSHSGFVTRLETHHFPERVLTHQFALALVALDQLHQVLADVFNAADQSAIRIGYRRVPRKKLHAGSVLRDEAIHGDLIEGPAGMCHSNGL